MLTTYFQLEPLMQMTCKLQPGTRFTPEVFRRLDGPDYIFGASGLWQALFVFRGRHCPICMNYLAGIQARWEDLTALGVEVAAISADNESKTRDIAAIGKLSFPLLYDLDLTTMRRLGLFISDPRSEKETDRPFSEPALLVTNSEGIIQLIEISNAPFLRTDVDALLNGFRFLLEKNYPVRGTRW